MKVNLNDSFQFTPSDDGKRWYAQSRYDCAMRMARPELMVMEVDSKGYARMQVWEFMQIFGPHISMTAAWPCVGDLEHIPWDAPKSN